MVETVLTSLASATAAATAVWLITRPRKRLAMRVRPYAVGSLVALGHGVDARSIQIAAGEPDGPRHAGSTLDRGLRRLLLRGEVDPLLLLRLLQSGRYDVPAWNRLLEHRTRQLLMGLAGGAMAGAAALLVDLSGPAVLGVLLAGTIAGGSRPAAAVEQAIVRRREIIRAELPTIAQLLALRIRAGGSVTAAITLTAERCTGLLAGDLAGALAQHRSGRPLEDALDAAATITPEPDAARLFRLLAATVRYGLDAAPELRRLSLDARTRGVARLRAEATRRRAALLLPTIGLLAPQMLIFIAAPLPSLLRGVT